jgi:hypothetical protein
MTKTIKLYGDAPDGWQDFPTCWDFFFNSSPRLDPPSPGWRRFEITVEIPCYGGSAAASEKINAVVTNENQNHTQNETKPN